MPTTVITGANSGMGYETALSLGQQGHELILCARSLAKGQQALQRMQHQNAGIRGKVFELNLDSLRSVQACAVDVLATYPVIDTLILNAGVMTPPFTRTEDGFESQFQTNYLGHFYLFQLLQSAVLASNQKKVISISSLSSEKGVNDSIQKFQADMYCDANTYDAMKCYRESKLAQILFTRELDQRFRSQGLMSYAVHPGVVNTNLFYRNSSSLYALAVKPLVWLGYATGKLLTPRQGAATALYLATQAATPGGVYWANRQVRSHNAIADQADFCREFWDWSLSLLDAKIFNSK